MWDFLKALVCGDLQNQITRLEAQVSDMEVVISNLEVMVSQKQDLIETYRGHLDIKETLISQLRNDIEDLADDLENANQQTAILKEALVKAIVPPDISAYLDPRVVLRAWDHPEIMRADPDTHKMIYDVEIMDDEYYAFTKENWLQLLEPIKTEVRRVLGGLSIPMTDCDNFAELTSAICHVAFFQAGLDRHGAVFIGEMSGVHAYNGFIDTDGTAWIYDPMKSVDPLIGELGETTGNYKTTDINFSG